LNSEIIYLEINPFWNVPAIIATKEIWPKAAKDPNYLKRNQLKVVRRTDGSVALRQEPGPNNSWVLSKSILINRMVGICMTHLKKNCIFVLIEPLVTDAFGLASYLLLDDPD
jgi:hypothetical protein